MTESKKLKELVPEGLLVSRKWLLSKGFSGHNLDNLVKAGELSFIVRGVYRRPGPPLKWQAVVISLQRESMGALQLAVGGQTALGLHGLSHFMRFGSENSVHLYGPDKMPDWLNKACAEAEFIYHNDRQLFKGKNALQVTKRSANSIRVTKEDSPFAKGRMTKPWGSWDWPLIISTPERAILEILHGVPDETSFYEAHMEMQSMAGLSPRRLDDLLMDCQSIKVKRLFLWFAERHQHAWLKRLNPDKYDLGRGKRSIAKGGKLDKKYQITVPEEMHG